MPEPNLPPAGHKRRDELARRKDTLEQQGEEQAAERGVEAIDPEKLEPDREIMQEIGDPDYNMLNVTHAQPEFDYCWTYTGPTIGAGLFIKRKVVDGYEVVQGDMPEAVELKGIGGDTTRRIGDVILMRIRKDRKILNDRRDRKHQKDREFSMTDGAIEDANEEAQRASGGVISVSALNSMSAQRREQIEKRSGGRSMSAAFGNAKGRK